MKKTLAKYSIVIASCSLVLVIICGIIIFNQKKEVPDVIGKNLAEATKALEESGFETEVVSEYSDMVFKDFVISQDITAGTEMKKGSVVLLKVSAGIEQITVPAVEDNFIEEAEKTLTDLGFSVTKQEAFSDDCEKGKVISQSVTAGKTIDKGSEITVVISKGPDLVQVPNLVGKSLKEATGAIASAGLKIKTDIKCSNTVKEGLIISQDMASGDLVKRNSEVSVFVSAGVSNTVGNTPANSQQHGIVAAQGDWVYFSNMRYNYYLYKMRTDGSEKQILTKDVVVAINVVGEWIYYINASDNVAYKIRTDGTGKSKLHPDFGGQFLTGENNVLFSSEHYDLQKIGTDGTNVI